MATVLERPGAEFEAAEPTNCVGLQGQVLNPIDTGCCDAEKTDTYFPACLSQEILIWVGSWFGLAAYCSPEARPGLWLQADGKEQGEKLLIFGGNSSSRLGSAKIPSEERRKTRWHGASRREVLGQQSRIHRGADGFCLLPSRPASTAISAELELKEAGRWGSLASRTKIMPAQGDKAQMGPMEPYQGGSRN